MHDYDHGVTINSRGSEHVKYNSEMFLILMFFNILSIAAATISPSIQNILFKPLSLLGSLPEKHSLL